MDAGSQYLVFQLKDQNGLDHNAGIMEGQIHFTNTAKDAVLVFLKWICAVLIPRLATDQTTRKKNYRKNAGN